MRVSWHQSLGFAGLALLVAGLVGCGGGSGRSGVQGTVSYGGEPVDNGTIGFVGADGARANGPIVDGKYSLDAERGPAPGKNKVEIYWNKKTGKKIPTPGDADVMMEETKQLLPDRYNTKTELTADITTSSNKVDFDLKK